MKVWLAVVLTALVREGYGSSIVDTLIKRSDDSGSMPNMLGLLGAKSLFDDDFVPSNETIFKPKMQSPYDIDVDKTVAARGKFSALKLNPVKMNIRGKIAPGLKGKMKSLKGGFQKLHKNKITQRAKDGWNKLKKGYKETKDKSKIFKNILKEAWNLLGNFELREIIFAALEELGLMPECSCYLNDQQTDYIKYLKAINKLEDFSGALLRCGCCIKPFGWKSLCVMVKANPLELTFELSLEFDDQEFISLPIKFKKLDDGVQPPKSSCVPAHRLVIGQERCAYLGDLPFIDICVRPREIEVHKEYGRITFIGTCIQIVVDFLYYTYEKCFQFDVDNRKLSVIEDEDFI